MSSDQDRLDSQQKRLDSEQGYYNEHEVLVDNVQQRV
jgi:hypothetical protein